MPHYRTVLILALAACCCVSCQREPLDTRAQDEHAIRDADAATRKAAQANDVNGVVANYADDADWLPPNASIVHGKTAIKAAWAKLIGNPGFTIESHHEPGPTISSGNSARRAPGVCVVESRVPSLDRALARRDMTVPGRQSNKAAIS